MKIINVCDYATEIMKKLKKGILITTKKDDKVNTMTISWGHLGIEWNIPIFVCYIRKSRHTYSMLDTAEFTVNIPLKNTSVKEITTFCGKNSGKNVDKIAALDLHLVNGQKVCVPAIKELPLTLECKVIHTQVQDSSKLPHTIQDHFYPLDATGKPDNHVLFYGQIVQAYIVE
ncbi:MAG TPA: flavin reductase family protein [Treponemataceae bacterium]|nr:flavin reductase family protein [Treponemataceae bacterium]